jgi:hypothetical protein
MQTERDPRLRSARNGGSSRVCVSTASVCVTRSHSVPGVAAFCVAVTGGSFPTTGAVKLVHSRTDAPRELPEEWRQLIEKLREIHADIEAVEIPPRIARLLGQPPDDRPPRGAPGQRIPRHYDEPAEEAEAAERHVA